MSYTDTSEQLGDIAIIGMAGRFPGARNTEEFWQNLRDGLETISFYSEEELLSAGIDPAFLKDAQYVRAGVRLPEIEMFDASFFGFTPREAEITDPQQRLFLECAWEALEAAGYDSERYKKRVGVYAGTGTTSYFLNIYAHPSLADSTGDFQIEIGNDKDHLSTRVSYKLNLKGPSLSVQTGCSTSLVATHLACQGLLDYECDMALAGGVSIGSFQPAGYFYKAGGVASPDGHCRAFDAKAQGTVSGSGVGLVVLKRLADALADGDSIYAVIKGSAINNDGSLKLGYTAPSVDGQAEVIAKALAVARVNPETITYVETHGTGTPLGDPVEIAALTKSFQAHTRRRNFCAVGSVKTNIGHLNIAAGVASLIKTVLALKHKEIPSSLHFEQPNPQIDFAHSPFYVNAQLRDWPRQNGIPRRAGVSSFGIGGTNAHVILEESPATSMPLPTSAGQLLLLSARSAGALEAATQRLAAHMRQHPEQHLADVCYTLQVGRREFNHRRMLVCRDRDEAIEALESVADKRVLTSEIVNSASEPGVVMMFPGQGSQYAGMGRELYELEPSYREEIDRCAEELQRWMGEDIRETLYPEGEEREGPAKNRLMQTALAQPALFMTEYALAKLCMKWGIRPAAMIGHSIGEYVAACLSGVMELKDALWLVVERARLMQQLPGGAMLAVALPVREVEPLLRDGLSLAAINSPSSCVVSGNMHAVKELAEYLAGRGVAAVRVPTSHAFHSEMMTPVVEPFLERAREIAFKEPQLRYVSNVTGNWIDAEEAVDASYWGKHLRQTVRFSDGVERLLEQSANLFLEVGPGRMLYGLLKQHAGKDRDCVVLPTLPDAHQRQPADLFILKTLGQFWLSGGTVDWQAYHGDDKRRRVPLPTYPFEREKFWIEGKGETDEQGAQTETADIKQEIAEWFYVPLWKQAAPSFAREADTGVESRASWLLFREEGGLGFETAEHLEKEGRNVISVIRGERFARVDERTFSINPKRREDYDYLFDALDMLGQMHLRIVHLWGLNANEEGRTGIELYEEFLERGFNSLLFVAQTIGRFKTAARIHLDVVTDNMQKVTGEERLCAEKAIILGPCKVIPKEYSNITCRSIDLTAPPPGTRQRQRLVNQLITELTGKPSDMIVALRGGQRWLQTIQAVRLESRARRELPLSEEGVYLITGGLSEVGLSFAAYLAQTQKARLILVDDEALPHKEEWENWLQAHDEEEESSRKVRRLRTFEEWGAQVLVFNENVADENRMRAVIDKAQKHFGKLQGVIHTQAVSGTGLIQLKMPEAAAKVLDPKVRGTLVLERVLKEQPLDFMVLFSSINSSLAGLGQVDECAANSFLDAFAHRSSLSAETLTTAIDWDAWVDDGQEEVSRGLQDSVRQMRAAYGITFSEGVEAFDRILGTALPQVIVSKRDFQRVFDRMTSFTTSDALEELERISAAGAGHARPALDTAYVAPRNAIERILVDIWQALFGIEPIGVYDNFMDLGGHSLFAIQLVSRIREAFQVELPLANVFEAPTVAELAKEMAEHQLTLEELDEIDQLFQEITDLSQDEVQKQLAEELRLTDHQGEHERPVS
jgi:acyl transferase domain-containing protein/acyl carrier protein